MAIAVPGGVFISFEGIEGSGKSTQARLLSDSFEAEGYRVFLTREPGGTMLGDRIRDILLDPRHTMMHELTELLLYNAARAQHLQEKIMPELAAGSVVITDRFTDSTVAYQGYGRGLDISTIYALDMIATGGFTPRLTVLLDMEVAEGLERNREARKSDRFELEALAFHQRVREGFLDIAKSNPDRFVIIDASVSVKDAGSIIRERTHRVISERLAGG